MPLEQTDPELAEHIRLIVGGEHAVASFNSYGNTRIYKMSDGRIIRRVSKIPGRNEVCSCGSGKKYKKCCGR